MHEDNNTLVEEKSCTSLVDVDVRTCCGRGCADRGRGTYTADRTAVPYATMGEGELNAAGMVSNAPPFTLPDAGKGSRSCVPAGCAGWPLYHSSTA